MHSIGVWYKYITVAFTAFDITGYTNIAFCAPLVLATFLRFWSITIGVSSHHSTFAFTGNSAFFATVTFISAFFVDITPYFFSVFIIDTAVFCARIRVWAPF